MALPFDPSTGAYVSGSAMGSLQPVNPVESPLQHQMQLMAAMAEQRAKDTALKQQVLRAAALKAMTDPDQVKGGGPVGIRIGQGPGGWATSLGDLGAAIIRAKALKKGAAGIIEATGELGPATQTLAENYLQDAPGGLYNSGYGMGQPRPVSQGSPLSLPLTF